LAATGRPIVCVCLTDKRSAQAAAELVAAGLGDVAVLRGGMRDWRRLAP
jgi:rhodanese-related sulfurtransferase